MVVRNPPMNTLTDRVAIVTGAAGALGQATVRHFEERGAFTVAIDRDAEPLGEAPGSAAHVCNLTDEASVRETFERIHQERGRIDILANVAGGFAMGPRIEETTVDDWSDMLRINALTAWLACKYALPFMRKMNFGRIINVGARAALKPAARMAPYCVSKAAVITLTETLALECAETGITANCILPGTIDTPRNRADMPNADHSRWVPPEDLAAAIGLLANPSSQSINGAIIPVYGRS